MSVPEAFVNCLAFGRYSYNEAFLYGFSRKDIMEPSVDEETPTPLTDQEIDALYQDESLGDAF
jgi:hypothetical protein